MIARFLLVSLALWSASTVARAEPPSPDEPPCREDRRCRLHHLRAELIQQRAEEARRLQQAIAVDQKRIEALKKEGQPIRRVRELSTDVFVSTTDKLGQGLLLGWGLNEHWRLELAGTFVSSYGWSDTSNYSTSGYAAMGRVRWTPFNTRLAPYAALGLSLQKHDYYGYGWSVPTAPIEPGDGSTGDVVDEPSWSFTEQQSFAHFLVPAVGVDLQLRFGLHLGIELQYPIPVYTMVRDAETWVQDDAAARGLMDGLKRSFAVGFVFGWAWDVL